MDQDNNSTSGMGDDVMLSSAEDLNNEMNFGMEAEVPSEPEEFGVPEEDVEIEREVEEIERTEEEPEERPEPVVRYPEHPVRHEHHHEHHERRECPKHNEDREGKAELVTMQVCKPRVNKLGLIWMIILTIILAGVVGMMVYAFLLRPQTSGESSGSDDSVVVTGDNSVAIAGALEVYLSEVNLSDYDSDIVLINRGGVVTVTGNFSHTLYVNATSSEKLILNGVKIRSNGNAALVNLGAASVEISLSGDNSLISTGENKYGATIYSDGQLTISGNGSLMVGAETKGMAGIATKNGYAVNGGNVVILGQKNTEEPLEASTQAYFIKDGLQTRGKDTTVTATDDREEKIAEFVSETEFSTMLVSNDNIVDGERYEINLKGASAEE